MRRFWFHFAIRFEDKHPFGVLLGCGVTARDRAEAEALIGERVFKAGALPPVAWVIEDVDVAALDPGHVLPNMGDPAVPGVWFPLGYGADLPVGPPPGPGAAPPLAPQRKYAYRWLLYGAMLDIRPLRCPLGWRQRLNPFCWWSNSRRVRVAGGLAEWLHNLARYSAADFAGFDEEWFWQSYQWLLDQFPGAGLEWYRVEFERRASSE